jgi:putative membrane protein
MPLLTLILMGIAALLHIGFFVMESLLWRRPAVHRLFGVADTERVEVMAAALLNQGFYNLFLAAGAIAGIVYSSDIVTRNHNELLVFTALFMIGAAVVLFVSNRSQIRGALIQGLPPLLALLAALVF